MTPLDSDRQHPMLTLAVLATAGLAFALLQSLVAPALPEIQRDLGISETTATWILTSYLLSASVATPILGRLGDMYGKERLLLVSIAVMGAGTLVSALASSAGPLIAGRVIQGAGGGIFPLAFGIVRDEFPRERVAGSIGLMSAIMGIGGGAGIVLAGVINDNLGYHWLFWIPLVVIAGAGLATWRWVPESPIKSPGRVDWVGGSTLALGLVCVLVGVSETSTWGWGSPKTLGLVGVGLAVLAAWVRIETRASEPLVDMDVMRIRGAWTTNVVAVLVGFGMYSSFILIPQLVEQPTSTGYGFGASVTATGLFMLPSTMAMLLVGPLAGRLDARFGSKPPLLAGAAFCAASYTLFAVAHDQRWEIYAGSALLGLGIGLSFAALANLTVAAVPQRHTGVATGINTIARTIGGGFGTQVVATVLAGHVMVGGHPSESGFTLAFAIAASVLVVAIFAGLAIPGRRTADALVAVPAR
jgi:EmrB/QacA subfamily drug resistance transporter